MTSSSEKQNNQEDTKSSVLCASVFDRIEKDHVAPLPKWQFLCVEYGIWTLWALSVLFGAIAFSVLIFFITHAGFAVYEATHDSAFDLFIDILPLAWVGVFGLMALLAHYNLRHTKCGYKYTVLRVLVSSIVFSFIGGLVLHAIGMSVLVDSFMAKQSSVFPALERFEHRIWQQPKEGRMMGVFISHSSTSDVALFSDAKGVVWQLNTAELTPLDMDTLYSGKRVHVIGIPSTTTESYVYGCGVLPGERQKELSFGDMRKEREVFVERMKVHTNKMFAEVIATNTPAKYVSEAVCKNHKAVLRVRRELE